MDGPHSGWHPMFLFDGCLTFPAVFSSLLVAARKSDNSPRDFDDLLTSKSTDLSLGSWFWMAFLFVPFCMGYLLVQSVVVICSYAIGGQRSHYDMLWWGCLVYFNILYWLFYLEITNRTTKDYLRWLFVKQQRDLIKQGYSNAQYT